MCTIGYREVSDDGNDWALRRFGALWWLFVLGGSRGGGAPKSRCEHGSGVGFDDGKGEIVSWGFGHFFKFCNKAEDLIQN